MINTFVLVEKIYDLLIDSQQNPTKYNFAMSADVDLNPYDPGDFRVDGTISEDGAYLYFEKTEFERSMMDNSSFTTEPKITLDIYSSRPAEEDGEGNITFSTEVAARAAEAALANIVGCLTHTTFIRFLNALCEADSRFGDTRCTMLYPLSCENVGTLKLTENSKSVCIYRMTFEVSITEIPGQASTFTLSEIIDRLVVYRQESDLEE